VQTDTGQWAAIVIVWSADKTMSALIAVSLPTMQFEVLLHEEVGNNQRLLISAIARLGRLFLVANLTGTVSVFKVPDFKTRVGCIMHNNRLADMVSSQSLTSTNILITNLFILETL
jgi:hypothetical protein